MKKWIFVIAVTALLGTAENVSAQAQHSPEPKRGNAGSFQAPLTPAQRAVFQKSAMLTSAALKAMQSCDYAEAEADARAALSHDALAGFADEVLAAALDAQGKTQEALQAYQVMVDEGESFPRNLLPYALLSLKAGNVRQAALAYNKSLPLIDNGELLRRNGGFSPDAATPTELAAAIHTALGLQLDWRGYHGTYQEVIQQSLVHFQKAAALEPRSPLANYYYGYGLQRLGRHAEAQKAFQKAATLDQNGEVKAAEKALSGR